MKTFVNLMVICFVLMATAKAEVPQGGCYFHNGTAIAFINFKNKKINVIEKCLQRTPFAVSADGTKMVLLQDGNALQKKIPSLIATPLNGLQKILQADISEKDLDASLSLSPDGKFLLFECVKSEIPPKPSYISVLKYWAVSLIKLNDDDSLTRECLRLPIEASSKPFWPASASFQKSKPSITGLFAQSCAFSHIVKWEAGERLLAVLYQNKEGIPGITILDLDEEKLLREKNKPGIYEIIFPTPLKKCYGLSWLPDGSIGINVNHTLNIINKDDIQSLIKKSRVSTTRTGSKTGTTSLGTAINNVLKISPTATKIEIGGVRMAFVDQDNFITIDALTPCVYLTTPIDTLMMVHAPKKSHIFYSMFSPSEVSEIAGKPSTKIR